MAGLACLDFGTSSSLDLEMVYTILDPEALNQRNLTLSMKITPLKLARSRNSYILFLKK